MASTQEITQTPSEAAPQELSKMQIASREGFTSLHQICEFEVSSDPEKEFPKSVKFKFSQLTIQEILDIAKEHNGFEVQFREVSNEYLEYYKTKMNMRFPGPVEVGFTVTGTSGSYSSPPLEDIFMSPLLQDVRMPEELLVAVAAALNLNKHPVDPRLANLLPSFPIGWKIASIDTVELSLRQNSLTLTHGFVDFM